MKKSIAQDFLSYITLKTLFLNLCIALFYIISGKFGLSFASVNPSATPVWAPTGIALSAILLFGYRVTPAIFLGAFVVNLTTAGTVATSLGIAAGNTLEGITGAYLVGKFANGIHAFSSVSDIFKFTFFAGVLSTMVSADIGVLTLLVGKLASWGDFWPVWTTWWLGDMGGDLIIAPLFLVWGTSLDLRIGYRKTLHLVLSFFVLWLTVVIVFTGVAPFPYLCIPIAVWIAFWFGRRGATITTLFVAGIAIFYTLHGLGPFAVHYSLNQSLALLHLFLGILSITALTFAALVHTIRKGEKILSSHERRFQALIEKAYDAVVLIDATSKILYASPSVKRVLGYSPEELQGKTGFDLVAPQNRQMTMRELEKLVLKPGGTVTVEYQTIRKDKKVIWVQALGTNLLLEDSVNAVVVNFHDITDAKIAHEKLLREKAEDEAMLASIGDGIMATDNMGKLTMINQAACDMLGFKGSELIGKHLVSVIAMADEDGNVLPAESRPMTKVLSLNKKIVTSQTKYYVKKDKTKLPVRFTLTPIDLSGKLVGTIEVFQDITAEKEVDKLKDEFISMAAHELRTPMTAVNGLLSMILNGDYGPINERLKKPLSNTSLSAKRQIHLINDLLSVSRLQTGRITFTLVEFSLREQIDDIVKSLLPIAQQKGITLNNTSKEDYQVQADSEWSAQIINNLIGNALKFTDRGGVTVSYRLEGDFVSLAVVDTGSGIDPSDYDKLFGRFQQISTSVSNKLAGSGLGLYLSRELARKMGGDVRLVKSTTGRGSTFVLTLPVAGTPAARKAQAELGTRGQIALSRENR